MSRDTAAQPGAPFEPYYEEGSTFGMDTPEVHDSVMIFSSLVSAPFRSGT
ncbi:hypothetical protein [uncultured Akkermansia sp.]|nr:hypothetical protein [uncultured Akkermansia sp.]